VPRALLSVYDKAGVVELAASLIELGWVLVSSGGTARTLADAGLAVTDVADLTGYPAILGHRVVTLHPRVHGGILADRDDPAHREDLHAHGIEPIDLVVSNLYPFGREPSVELIDIGGPALVRAAAKNHAHVGVVTGPDQYADVLSELRSEGMLSEGTRRRLARAAFAHTAAYDAAIVGWLDTLDPAPDGLPPTLHLALERAQELRYGENPHQRGARYRTLGGLPGSSPSWWDDAVQHGGKELSYLNVYDAEAAWRLVHSLGERAGAAVVIVKHANPCGVAVADDLDTAYANAHAADPVSAFGGIVATNRPMTASVAAALAPVFTEVVVAPGYEAGALETLTAKKNLRVIEARPPSTPALHVRTIDGGLLVQTPDQVTWDPSAFRVATRRTPSAGEWADLELAWRVVAAVTSNTIVLARDGVVWGIGAGQQNRVDAGRIAAEKAAGRAVGGACASDAFFPFRDGLDAAAGAGCSAVIQPGGSVRDDEVIAAADEHGMAMVFTAERHFRH
jgi:phosphoribosylaminoimidazolecarboxamide formyltransferase/IMP cyclohydrolase